MADPAGPANYVSRIRTDGVWADDIELQVMSEIYDCSIEVYADSTNPIKIFNEKPQAIEMRVRLHYLGGCHYDVIWDSRRTTHPLQGHAFGNVESASIDLARERNRKKSSMMNQEPAHGPSQASRAFFEKTVKKNIVEATTNSLSTLEKDFEDLTKGVIREHETQMTEDELLKSVMAQSIKDAYAAPRQVPITAQNNKSSPSYPTPQKPNMAMIIQLASMGYDPMECQRAISQLPATATISQIIDKIETNRENQLYVFY